MRKHLHALVFLCVLLLPASALAAGALTCWFPPGWKSKAAKAKAITRALTEGAGITVKPRIAKSYPEILEAFSVDKPNLVYVGSFVQTIIQARKIGTPLVQAINGKQQYGAWMIFPKGKDPQAILKSAPKKIAFALGASSGESGAKAATGGKASMGVRNHGAAANAVKAGKAKAAFVKNWWWKANGAKYPMLDVYQVPGISTVANNDNVLTASKAVPADVRVKIADAAKAAKAVFGADEMAPLPDDYTAFSLSLMRKGGIDPLTYSW